MTDRLSQPDRDVRAEPIAIIGMSCRFPHADDLEGFWKLLCEGTDAITRVPRSRFDVGAFYDPKGSPGKLLTDKGGFLTNIDSFDAAFFRLAPREASRMDPQQRLLLEVAWEALEHGGQIPSQLVGSRTGVFVGLLGSDYGDALIHDVENVDIYVNTGAARSVMSGRLSFFFGFEGPSLSVDTACSSSMVALHLACESIRSGECVQALAAGCNLVLAPNFGVGFAQAGNQAKDGRCKAFDAKGDGFVRSEGIAVLALKRLSAAIADKDPIQAIIRGDAVTNDGSSNGLLMTPSKVGQMNAMRTACERAGVSPRSVHFVEAHGTGTSAGDPVEMGAIGALYGEGRDRAEPVFVGSVKTNIGHAEGAAGLAGTIKAALALKHRVLPGNLHFETPNPEIPWADLAVKVPVKTGPWPYPERALAGVSSFGISGTNAHIVLEEPPHADAPVLAEGPFVLALSAQTSEGLTALVKSHQELLARATVTVQDLCYTSTQRRTHHAERLALVGSSRPELASLLNGFLQGESAPALSRARAEGEPKVVFVFPGQGSQWFGMGRELFEKEPTFRAQLARCDAAISAIAGWSLLEVLRADHMDGRWEDVDFLQPALFSMQTALAALWQSWGVRPAAVIGHSMGEVAAAYVAGALELEDAVQVICERSALVKTTRGKGRMLSVELSHEAALELLQEYGGRVSVAVSSSPTSSVLSGDPVALEAISKTLEQRDVFCRFVKVDYASHSTQMDPLRGPLLRALAGIRPHAGVVPFYSTALGKLAPGEALDAEYWFQNLRNPVLFSSTVQALARDGHAGFLEVSAHPLLTAPMGDCLKAAGASQGFALGSLYREHEERSALLRTVAALHAQGVPVAFRRIFPEGGRCVALPNYPWQRARHWVEVQHSKPVGVKTRVVAPGGHPLLGERVALARGTSTQVWQSQLRLDELAFLGDHRVNGTPIFPGVGYAELALAASEAVLGASPKVVRGLDVQRAMFLSVESPREVQIVADALGQESVRVQVYSRGGPDEAWESHALATVERLERAPAQLRTLASTLALRESPKAVKSGKDFYGAITAQGYDYQGAFCGLEKVWSGDGEALSRLQIPASVAAERGAYHFHPALLDACLHGLLTAYQGDAPLLPVRFERITVLERQAAPCWAHATLTPGAAANTFVGTVQVWDEAGKPVAMLEGVKLFALGGKGQADAASPRDTLYELAWLPAKAERAEKSEERRGALLVLTDARGVGEAFAARAEKQGRKVIRVEQGGAFAKLTEARFQVRAGDGSDLHQLFAALGERCAELSHVVHLWGVDLQNPETLTGAQLLAQQGPGTLTMLRLLHELSELTGPAPRLWVGTCGAQQVGTEQKTVVASQTTLWGSGRVVPQELPALWGGLVDLDPAASTDEAGAQLWSVLSDPAGENQIAVRGDQRFHVRIIPLRTRPEEARALTLRPDGTYLITGGLGDLGLETAKWLADNGARRLILMGRTPLPPRETWTEAAKAGGRLAHQLGCIRQLEAQGIALHIACCDLGDERALGAYLAQFRAEGWPSIRGVIHSAVVVADKTIAQLGADAAGAAASMEQSALPKLVGGWNLHRLLSDEPLDFFYSYSSAAATLGNPGQAVYAACNGFLDGLAHHRRSLGKPAMSIAWGPWSELGLAVRLDTGDRLARRGMHSLTPAAGMAAFAKLVHVDRAQVSAMVLEWAEWRRCYPGRLFDLLEEAESAPAPVVQLPVAQAAQAAQAAPAAAPAAAGALSRASLMALTPDERARFLGDQFARYLQRILGLSEPVKDHAAPLNKMGMDSLMAVELKNRIDRELAVTVPVVKMLKGMSVKDLVGMVLTTLDGEAPAAAAPTPPVASPVRLVPAPVADPAPLVEAMSDKDVDQVLKQMLSKLGPG